jgi:hemerythrin superfamily protein
MAQRKRSGGRRSTNKKASSRRASARGTARKPDALRMLKDDHQRVQQLFERFERTRGDAQKERVAGTICDELKVHAQLEEELFYPAVREAIPDSDLMNEAEVEHASAKELIAQIEDSSPSDERYEALVTVLGEYIKHHVKEEETEMFKKVRQSDLDLAALGEEMRERKGELLGVGGAGKQGGLASMIFGRTGS